MTARLTDDGEKLLRLMNIEKPKRYGIIPCRRCAFFNSRFKLCMRHPPTIGSDGDALFPEVIGFVMDPTGCGDGLLREEAAPLPPEQQEPKP